MLVATVTRQGINTDNIVWFKLYEVGENYYGSPLDDPMLRIVTNAGTYDEMPHEISYQGEEAEYVFALLQRVTEENGWTVKRR